jgi:hypothetical protein
MQEYVCTHNATVPIQDEDELGTTCRSCAALAAIYHKAQEASTLRLASTKPTNVTETTNKHLGHRRQQATLGQLARNLEVELRRNGKEVL